MPRGTSRLPAAPAIARGPNAWLRTVTPLATAAIVLVLGVTAYVSSQREAESTRLVEHTHEVIDGNQYSDCKFENCQLIYRGGPLPVISNSQFNNCRWRLAKQSFPERPP